MGKSRLQAFFTGDPTGGSVARDRGSSGALPGDGDGALCG